MLLSFLPALLAVFCAQSLPQHSAHTAQAKPAPSIQSPLPGFERIEVLANTFTGNRQQDPAVAADSLGNLLVAWGSRRQEQGTFGIFAELMDPKGRPLTTELHVNQFLPREQAKPAVAFAADGTAWVLWHSVGQDRNGVGLYARRFGYQEEGFGPLGDEFPIAPHAEGDQLDAVLCPSGSGGMMVAWTGYADQRQVIFARHFATDGTPQGSPFALSSSKDGWDRLVSLAPTPTGVVAVWAHQNQAQCPEGILGALWDGQAEEPLKPFVVSPGDSAFDVEPCVDTAQDGSFVVAWMSSQNSEDYTAKAQRFSAAAKPLGEALIVDAGGSPHRSGAQVAVAADSRFVVAYNSHLPKQFSRPAHRPTEPASIFGQRFSASGQPLGGGFRWNQFDEGEQSLQVGVNAKHLLWTAQDQLVAAWHGALPADSRGVGVTLFVPQNLTTAPPPALEPKAAGLDITADMVHGDAARPHYNPWFRPGPYVQPPPAAGGSGGFEAIQNTGWTPPDPDLAVGPTHIVTMANGEISFFTKAGVQTFATAIAGGGGFWGSVGAGGFVFDPVCLYDPHTDRFVVAAADGAGSGDAILIAMSDDNDPNGTWYKYRFPVSSTCVFLDFPNLGINEDAIYIAGDCFSGGGNRVFMWDKSKVMAGLPVSMKQIQTNGSTISLGATKNYDTNSPAYFATTYSSSSSRIMLKAITNPNTTPTLFQREISVPGFSFPPDATQLGTSNRADTIDWRIKNGVVRNGSLWITHNTGPSTARVAWYEIALNGWPLSGSNPTLVQSGTLDFGNGEHNWYGDINVAADGSAVIAFNRSSSSQYISIEFVTRKPGDPLGTFSAPKQLQISTSPETGSRWGDYSGVEQDPLDPTLFWSHHEYRTAGWRTWVGEFNTTQDLNLSITGLTAGANSTWTVDGAASGETVHYLVSLNAGTWAPPQLGGLVLDLGTPATYVGSAVANSSGTASLVVAVPAGAPVGATAYLQAAAIRGVGGIDSVKSNLVTTTIQ